jgi:hypothetical protein
MKRTTMTIQRMGNGGIVVEDRDAPIAFLTELGMEREGEAQIEGLWADRTVGLDGVRSDIAMMRTPDGHGKLELAKYHTPRRSPPHRRASDTPIALPARPSFERLMRSGVWGVLSRAAGG